MRQTTDANALVSVALAVQALRAKLTQAQAQEVLDAVGTTSLAQAVAGKLTDAPQAQRALDTVLEAMQKTTDASGLMDLARAVQVLPGNLTEAQAQQALDAVLQQMQRTTDLVPLQRLAQAVQALAGKLTDAVTGATCVRHGSASDAENDRRRHP
jgi:succinyl-CoA synthetase alpha subunit